MSQIQKKKKSLSSDQTKSGFTLIELSLAMAFIALLLIAIAVVTINIIAIFQKGATLKAVNSVGRSLIDDLTSTINASPSVDTISLCNKYVKGPTPADPVNYREKCIKDSARDFIYHANYDSKGRQYNGIFCTGSYSYLWNTYYGLRESYNDGGKKHAIAVSYITANNGTRPDGSDSFRLMKIKDSNFHVCASVMNDDYTVKTNVGSGSSALSYFTPDASRINLSVRNDGDGDSGSYTIMPEPEIDTMLRGFDTDLMLYELTIFPISQDSVTLRTYMSGTFILATLRGDIDVTRSGDYCRVDGNRIPFNTTADNQESVGGSISTLSTDFNYCAINKFNFAARTAGSAGV